MQDFLFILVPENGCVKNELFVFGLVDFSHPKSLLWKPANTEEKSKHKSAKYGFRFLFLNVSHPHLNLIIKYLIRMK